MSSCDAAMYSVRRLADVGADDKSAAAESTSAPLFHHRLGSNATEWSNSVGSRSAVSTMNNPASDSPMIARSDDVRYRASMAGISSVSKKRRNAVDPPTRGAIALSL